MNTEKIQAIFQKWVALTGVDPEAKSFTFTMSQRNFDIHDANREIQSAMKHDPSGMTAAMLFGYHLGKLLENTGFSVQQILTNPETFHKTLDACKELSAMVYDEDIQAPIRAFNDRLIQSLQHYGAYDREDVQKVVTNVDTVAFIRLASVRSIDDLRVNQFSDGQPSKKPLRYMTKVFGWSSVNALLDAIRQVPESFISLNLIRNMKNPELSYFCFAIKNGERTYVVSDTSRGPHPMYDSMSRRPDRHLAERIDKNLFPYDLAGVEWRDSRSAYIHTDTTAIADLHTAATLSDINTLHPNQVLWISMMFNLLNDKFWSKDYQTKELSFTGAKMRVERDRVASNLPALTGQELLVPTLTPDTLTRENTKEWFEKSNGQNEWMEKRYGHMVPEDVLNLTPENETLLLPSAQKELDTLEYDNKILLVEGGTFGTAEELQSDRMYLARYNQARIISREAKTEFNKTMPSVKAWYLEKLRANMDRLLEVVAYGDMKVGYDGDDIWGYEKKFMEPFVRLTTKDESLFDYTRRLIVNETQPSGRYDDDTICPVTGAKTTPLVALFEPKIPEHLAFLCGCEVADLPEVLQHWRFDELNGGNHLLENIDPMDWAAENPWIKRFPAKARLYLSKSGYNTIRKQHGLPQNKYWEA